MEAVVRPKDGKIMQINGAGHGGLFSKRYEYYTIPDQPISDDWWDEDGNFVADLKWPDDLIRDMELEAAIIDRDTGNTISTLIHQFAGTDEQLGILRDQLVQIINTLGLAPTPDFTRLNEIAVKAVEEGAQKRAAL